MGGQQKEKAATEATGFASFRCQIQSYYSSLEK